MAEIKGRNCDRYVGINCVDGNCPFSLYEEYPWEIGKPESCDYCPKNKGCSDCAWNISPCESKVICTASKDFKDRFDTAQKLIDEVMRDG